MSSTHSQGAIQHVGDPASCREVMRWVWPAGTRGVLAVLVIAAALGLVGASQSLPGVGAPIVPAPDLRIDVNTVPPTVLGTLPHFGQTLVRHIIAARDTRPIESLEDAGSRVRGLGPVTLAQIGPYLRFEPAVGPGGEDSGGDMADGPAAKPAAPRKKTPARSRKKKLAPPQPHLVARADQAERAD
jgi:Helix-hairpin-helix motif